ncbi:hypothetical protein Tco_0606051 [Tanacetum coccineum]
MEEINNFQQEPNENLYQPWGRFKELLMKCPQHYLTEIQEVILFYNGLGIPTRQILDSRGAIPYKTVVHSKVAIRKMAEYSQKWHNRTSRSRSTKTSDRLAAIQAQLNNLRREIMKFLILSKRLQKYKKFHIWTGMRCNAFQSIGDNVSRVARPKIEDKDNFELKGQFLKELHTNTFSSSDHEDVNEHIEKVLEIVDLFHIPNITIDQLMLRAFPMSSTRSASRWLRNEPTGSITTWDGLKTKILNKYCPPARTTRKMEEINNFQQEPNENLYQPWGRFKELLMKCPQHYLTEIQEVILFYNGLGIPTRQILDSRGAIPYKTVVHSKCKGPHYTKDFPLKEEGKTLDEAYYMQFGGLFQRGGYRAATPGFYQRNDVNPSYQERRQSMEDTLSKFMSESTKRHEENSKFIKEIRALTDAAIQNQGASIKTLEIQIRKMSKVLQEIGFGSLPSSTEANPRDQVKSISTIIEVDSCPICHIGSSQ